MTRSRYRQLAIVTTVGICVLVVAGGVVRLTGSGLGCDDWPNCNDERFIDVSSGHTAIEQLNRLLSGLIGVPTVLLVVCGFRAAPRGAGLRWPAVGVLVSVLANGVVGGLAVRGDLHPALVQSHFLLAMVSIAFGLIAVRAGSERPIVWRSVGEAGVVQRLSLALAALTGAALVTGTIVTGAGPHAGEEDVRRYGFDIGTVARVHSVTVLVTIACAIALAWVCVSKAPTLRPALSTWLFVAIVQGGVGYAQYLTGVPELLVGVHLAGATALWVATVRLALSALDCAPGAAEYSADRVRSQGINRSGVTRV
ncbi:COX15/CtaA family protein [Ilumatobacter nonamiensis]|uniref:COX15/CtaA family protein n=1 Tax=Ilumatobacter nonamiensis TaxID=467093 RepID=UPI000688452C|nr:COX15/CtaA family protein [Ilumatobacter nonamiensis]